MRSIWIARKNEGNPLFFRLNANQNQKRNPRSYNDQGFLVLTINCLTDLGYEYVQCQDTDQTANCQNGRVY
jgi:hypothetical protein